MEAGKATLGVLIGAAICASAPAARAQQADSPLKSAMKLLGFATDPPKAPDFVIQSRPKGDLDYIPVFQSPPEPANPALTGDQLKAMKGELEFVAETYGRASLGLSTSRQSGRRTAGGEQEAESRRRRGQVIGKRHGVCRAGPGGDNRALNDARRASAGDCQRISS